MDPGSSIASPQAGSSTGTGRRRRGRRARLFLSLGGILVVALGVYLVYAGWEGSRQLLEVPLMRRCDTPAQLGWAYEAINYDIADDARLVEANPDLEDCASPGMPAGDDVVSSDGIRIAGWYVPSADGDPPDAPTVVLVHGWGANKSDMLRYAAALHPAYNLVLFDLRHSGQSTGTQSTGGVLETRDLRAILDWLDSQKHPGAIGVLGDSGGAATAITLARTDGRILALVLDSMHARTENAMGTLVEKAGHPRYPAVWAIQVATWIRTGVNVADADPVAAIPYLGDRPILLLHGTADTTDVPADTAEVMLAAARAAGVQAELRYCEGATHGQVVSVCADRYASWVVPFYDAALGR
jgi:pimeloyl-ACP methyl ester carboxylesterase